MRALVLALGAALLAAPRVADANEEPRFLDRHGTLRSFEREYDAWFENRKPHYLRAAGEALLLTGLGTAYYWADPLANADSWDDPALGDKFSGEAVSFDNNLSSTNFVMHPFAGASVYGFSRSSGLDVYASALYATASSLLWEYLLEWREKVSINDLVVTPFGGLPLGEFLFQLGGYVSSTPWNTSVFNGMARYTLGLPAQLNADITRPVPGTGLPPDALGFSSAYWHRFAASYGFGALSNDQRSYEPVHSLRIGSEIVAMPGFLRPGNFELGFDEGNFTAGSLRLLLNGDGLVEADARVSAVLLGYYSQMFAGASGSGKLLGIGSELRYYESWRLGRRDGFAFAHLPGPVAAVWAKSGELGAFARTAGSVDFGALRPMGFDPWRAAFGSAGVKSVLAKQGYVYAFCGSTRNEVTVSFGPFGAGGAIHFAVCRSLQGLDRVQSQVVHDVPSTDTLLELGTFVSARGLGPFELRLEAEELRHSGSMGTLSSERRDRRAAGVIQYLF